MQIDIGPLGDGNESTATPHVNSDRKPSAWFVCAVSVFAVDDQFEINAKNCFVRTFYIILLGGGLIELPVNKPFPASLSPFTMPYVYSQSSRATLHHYCY